LASAAVFSSSLRWYTCSRYRSTRRKVRRQGHVDVRVAALLAAGFAVGVFAGGRWAQAISDLVLRRVFAVTLVLVATRMWFER
jgi:uncharacterized membrane protein YfcA